MQKFSMDYFKAMPADSTCTTSHNYNDQGITADLSIVDNDALRDMLTNYLEQKCIYWKYLWIMLWIIRQLVARKKRRCLYSLLLGTDYDVVNLSYNLNC